MTTRAVGRRWEDAALTHLEGAGLRLVARNVQCRHGEIDLIVEDAQTLAFVEVRYRARAAHGDGTASIGAAKRRKLVHAAQWWLQQHPDQALRACRFDVIGCSGTLAQPRFDWTRNAFDAADDA